MGLNDLKLKHNVLFKGFFLVVINNNIDYYAENTLFPKVPE